MQIKKIEGTWFIVRDGELIDSFDSKQDALNSTYAREVRLSEFDRSRKWESLYDVEKSGYRR